jgi:hypothetical protein
MKLYIRQFGDKEVARVELVVNELTGEKKVFKGWLNAVGGERPFKVCELKIDTTVDQFGRFIKQ